MSFEVFETIKINFQKNQESVRQLLDLDRTLLEFCIISIEALEVKLKSNSEIQLTNVHFLPSSTLSALKNIRTNDSLRAQYDEMFNQGLVLAVSHFSTAIHSIFKEAINQACRCSPDSLTAMNEDIKITFEELKNYNFDLTERLGDLLVKKKDISFQDMQSVHRAFKTFFNLDLERTTNVNNIIFAQAARHSIVHAEGLADEKFIKQIKGCENRTIKQNIIPNEKILFSTIEINEIQACMSFYINNLILQLDLKIGVDPF
ncbi:MAG: hypothetical protein Q8K92_09010 [Leadbetterella sp.]|nr:hypothetical protein [Leadbetterella sp.]